VTYTATQSGSGNINNTVTMPAGRKITYKATGTISASAITPVHRTPINSDDHFERPFSLMRMKGNYETKKKSQLDS
jgi:hypothetical protein